jgi:hypothetical protein
MKGLQLGEFFCAGTCAESMYIILCFYPLQDLHEVLTGDHVMYCTSHCRLLHRGVWPLPQDMPVT